MQFLTALHRFIMGTHKAVYFVQHLSLLASCTLPNLENLIQFLRQINFLPQTNLVSQVAPIVNVTLTPGF